MANPLSATKFRDAIRGEGVRVVEVGSWTTHNRGNRGTGWGPLNGIMIHHTVTEGTEYSVALCRDGHSKLPGPLCHGVIDKAGTVHLVGYGRANHAGSGDDDVLAAVINERSLPADNELNTDGNSRFYGFECINLGDGADPWPEVQVEAIARTAAGICRAHGWGAESVIGHLEWQPGKIDPCGPIGKKGGPALTMGKIRTRVAQILDDDTTPAPSKPAPSKPSPKVVDLSQLITAARHDPAKSGTPVSYTGVRVVEDALATEGLLERKYVDGHYGTTTRSAYARWQRRCGYSGAAADGIPGRSSLDQLAHRHGFRVAA
ncbi:N-acetylmuramoyl-L-alanine amidase [Streptomyces nigrescens]|uniref:N-acetylmuramoyl-L-alanine amidase n=1 Tax=Streptomyces nigrescens TaxID=1920 RepID=UPI0036CD70C9